MKVTRTKKSSFWLIAVVCLLLAACGTNSEYDTIQGLPNEGWVVSNVLKFPVEIKDKNKPHELYYAVRYDNSYPYYNFYVKRTVLDSAGKNVEPEKLQHMDLFNPATGAPYGSGIGSKKDYSFKSQSDVSFPYNGKFTIEVKQYMRIDTIPGISAFGIRLEKKP